jgi:bifunctional DNase/RNase
MVQLRVEAVALDWKGNPLVVLREKGGQRAVFIWVGMAEASAISMHLENQAARRPMTHDLILLVVNSLSAKVDHVVITDMQQDTYFADLKLNVSDRTVDLDCRPSDAIAVALRAGAPIFIDSVLLDRLEDARKEAEGDLPAFPTSTVIDTGETTVH